MPPSGTFIPCKTVRLLTQLSLWNEALWFILATGGSNKDQLSQSHMGPSYQSYLPLAREPEKRIRLPQTQQGDPLSTV